MGDVARLNYQYAPHDVHVAFEMLLAVAGEAGYEVFRVGGVDASRASYSFRATFSYHDGRRGKLSGAIQKLPRSCTSGPIAPAADALELSAIQGFRHRRFFSSEVSCVVSRFCTFEIVIQNRLNVRRSYKSENNFTFVSCLPRLLLTG
jgi:hypothetical protein